MQGERLSQLVSWEGLKLAAGVVILSPFIPLLFMGEEYGETAPFQYFVSFLDQDLAAAVRRGRKEEFAAFQAQEEPPDPQDEETFRRSRLNHGLKTQEPHRTLRRFYRELLRLRRQVPALAHLREMTLPLPAGRWQKLVDSADQAWLGPGPQGPESLTSTGEVTLPLAPQALVLVARTRRLL